MTLLHTVSRLCLFLLPFVLIMSIISLFEIRENPPIHQSTLTYILDGKKNRTIPCDTPAKESRTGGAIGLKHVLLLFTLLPCILKVILYKG